MKIRTLFILFSLFLIGCASPTLRTSEKTTPERQQVIQQARSLIGTPYRYGGTTVQGLDCSGAMQTSYAHQSIQIPRDTSNQFNQLPRKKVARPGDLLFFRSPKSAKVSHVGMYAGNGHMVHASSRRQQVIESPVYTDYWQKNFLGAASVLP